MDRKGSNEAISFIGLVCLLYVLVAVAVISLGATN